MEIRFCNLDKVAESIVKPDTQIPDPGALLFGPLQSRKARFLLSRVRALKFVELGIESLHEYIRPLAVGWANPSSRLFLSSSLKGGKIVHAGGETADGGSVELASEPV